MFESFFAKIAGRFAAKKLDLQGDSMDDTKPWYKSVTIWSAVVSGLVGIYNSIAVIKKLPPIPEWAYTFLGAIGVYGRTSADTKIG